jgi:hypothetical protein
MTPSENRETAPFWSVCSPVRLPPGTFLKEARYRTIHCGEAHLGSC